MAFATKMTSCGSEWWPVKRRPACFISSLLWTRERWLRVERGGRVAAPTKYVDEDGVERDEGAEAAADDAARGDASEGKRAGIIGSATPPVVSRGASASSMASNVTAEEAAQLDLEGTWLTTLSACETAAGHVRAGEGVLGLRRAFAQAGTQNLLITLWPISDDEKHTPDFMKAFYEEALRTGDAPRALANTQKEMLIHWRDVEEEPDLGVRYFAPFVLTFRGSLQ